MLNLRRSSTALFEAPDPPHGHSRWQAPLLAIVLFLSLVVPSRAVQAQTTSEPGAVGTNGNFFAFRELGTSLQVCEWNNAAGAWVYHQTYNSLDAQSPPSARTSTGGFHFIVTSSGSRPYLLGWEPGTGISNFFYPPGWPSSLSAPSEMMYGNRVFMIGDGSLYERFVKWSSVWFHFGKPAGKPLATRKPCVLQDGKLFVTTEGGELWQMWWNTGNNTWNWANHGYPKKFNVFGTGGVKAISVGAPMPISAKVFVTCNDGSLRQLYHNGSSWVWYDHGIPFGWRVDSPAVSIWEGKLFVTGDWDHNGVNTRVLLQLYWNGSTWVWFDHGTPPGTSISGGAAGAFGADRVVVKGTDGNFYMCFWNGSSWAWRNCGHP